MLVKKQNFLKIQINKNKKNSNKLQKNKEIQELENYKIK